MRMGTNASSAQSCRAKVQISSLWLVENYFYFYCTFFSTCNENPRKPPIALSNLLLFPPNKHLITFTFPYYLYKLTYFIINLIEKKWKNSDLHS